MRFSGRLPSTQEANSLTTSVRSMRRAGVPLDDLTESNPTHAGIEYPPDLLRSLADPRALLYEPEPFGLSSARAAVSELCRFPVDQIALASSTSEVYAWLFKLLCDPGDEVLIPRPSYPLFEHLASLEGVSAKSYGLFYDDGWYIDFHTLERNLGPGTRAIVLVNPNNPTGHFLHRHEAEQLAALCRTRNIAVISDEVFSDYRLQTDSESVLTLRDLEGVLTFVLNGLSKTVGLPQMKLAWVLVDGPGNACTEAIQRLELIADTYLSVGTPVQLAVPRLLEARGSIQEQILRRLRTNLAVLGDFGIRTLRVEGGWYAVIPLPRWRTEDEWVHWLLHDCGVLVQPGYFFDFERSGYAVVSLLTAEAVFRRALERGIREMFR